MKKLILFFFLMTISLNGFSQNSKKNQEVDIIDHEVQLGESVKMLSKKYLTDPSEIYRLNKFAVDGISQGMILKIPVPRKEVVVVEETNLNNAPEPVSPPVIKKVVKEVPVVKRTVEKEKVNAEKVIAEKEKPIVVSSDNFSEISHTVEPKETLYSISRKYNVPVDEIKSSNQKMLINGLKIGQVIIIPSTKGSAGNDVVSSVIEPASSVSKVVVPQEQVAGNNITHKVEPKETLYSLSKKYNVTVDEIKQQNKVLLQKGLQVGQLLTINKSN
ncbi:LysM peptidoglycan-binding domain-containing protein [Flavobacterium psychrotolerans]|uniref:LysM domain-containing protein n=1 Tax=Flavobacterium psychrotolerans TaxID=2169410 RepID=A0A2U1JR25_9FLAO|nr:LysM peptidoglycan-binding domain-containing protein [Flavobacterium psychrotolerans]PWA07424.1 hypothetical protein DB895_01520 [Flavobacterium psychrotolerans]